MLQPFSSILVAGSFSWFMASSLWIYPHSLSYFNEAIGGPCNGPDHLLGSNLDWGQDLKYVDAYASSSYPRNLYHVPHSPFVSVRHVESGTETLGIPITMIVSVHFDYAGIVGNEELRKSLIRFAKVPYMHPPRRFLYTHYAVEVSNSMAQ
jgi:hypothetical protein